MYKYETHCHTAPVSKCGKASVEDTVRFYKQLGYDGIFITNHFLDGNINPEARVLPYRDQIDYYFSDYEEAVSAGSEIGIKVFPGVELSYRGTDFLIYGLDKEWYKAHPEILEMKKTEELPFMMEAGAFVAEKYGFLKTAGSDNHWGSNAFAKLREKGYIPELAAMCSEYELQSVEDFISGVRNGTLKTCLVNENGNVRMMFSE